MEKVAIVKAEENWEVEAKSGIVEASGNYSGDISIVKAEDNWKEVVAKSVIVEASGNKKIKPDESASVEQGVGESKTVSETEKMLESMKELNKKLMEMTYKGKLTCEYDKKDMKSKNKSNDDDEEAVKGCMSWLL